MKKIILLAFAICLSLPTFAQFTIRNGAGFTGSFLNKEYVMYGDPMSSYQLFRINKTVLAYGILIYPQYHLNKKETPSKFKSKRREEPAKFYDFAIGLPTMLSLNIGFAQGQNISSILYNIAPSFDINIGSMTAKGQSKSAGAFIGLGLGVANTNQMNSDFEDITGLIDPKTVNYKIIDPSVNYKIRGLGFGPMAHFGGEVINPLSRFQGSKLGLRFAYQPAINRGGVDYFSINLLSTFGRQNNGW